MKNNKKNTANLLFETIYHGQELTVITDFLKQTSPLSSRNLRQYFFKGMIYLNHKKAHSQAKLKNGDLIQVYVIREEGSVLNPEAMSLDIVYEDNDLLVLNKPAKIAVHPSGNITSGTLANGVAAYFLKKGLKLKVRPVNRLDYGTSGLIIFAKNAILQTKLSEEIQKHLIKRIYYAVVEGSFDSKSGTINLPIISSTTGKRKVDNQGRSAVTHYQVIEPYKTKTLLELDIETGRTHQIRIHLSHIGHPILGDNQYGKSSPLINRPALHAGKVNFDASTFSISELTAPFPEDFEQLLAIIKRHAYS